jgi:hypothetical protein
MNPKYQAVVPLPDIARVPLAYTLASHYREFADFLSQWIKLKKWPAIPKDLRSLDPGQGCRCRISALICHPGCAQVGEVAFKKKLSFNTILIANASVFRD